MTQLFMKITNEMVTKCKKFIMKGEKSFRNIWIRPPTELIKTLEICIKLNHEYQRQYAITKEKLMTMPKGKQFDFSESSIFGKFNLFCKRLHKLIEMFNTIQQFKTLE